MPKTKIEDLPEKKLPEGQPDEAPADALTDEELKPVCGGGISTTPPKGSRMN